MECCIRIFRVFEQSHTSVAPGILSEYSYHVPIHTGRIPLASCAEQPNRKWESVFTSLVRFQNLASASSRLYGAIATQMASQQLFVPASNTIRGTTSTYEPRLLVHVLSLILMEIILAVLVPTALCFCIKVSGSGTSRDPGSIGGIATIFSASANFINLSRGVGKLALAHISDRLCNQRFRTILYRQFARSTFGIDTYAVTQKMPENGMLNEVTRPPIWWQPRVLRRAAKIATITFFVTCIILLEMLYQLSHTPGGILQVNTNSYTHYAWKLMPALFMVTLHLFFSTINLEVRLLHLYWLLTRRTTSVDIILDDPFGRISIQEVRISAHK